MLGSNPLLMSSLSVSINRLQHIKLNPVKGSNLDCACVFTDDKCCIGYWFLNQSNTSTMAEKAIFFQLKARKSYFNVEMEYLLGNSKLRQRRNYFTVICTLSLAKTIDIHSNLNKNDKNFQENCNIPERYFGQRANNKNNNDRHKFWLRHKQLSTGGKLHLGNENPLQYRRF